MKEKANDLTIQQSVVTIQVVRVGNRQMTKAVWEQIPKSFLFELVKNPLSVKVLGWVNGKPSGYLINKDGDIRVVDSDEVVDSREKDAFKLAKRILSAGYRIYPFFGCPILETCKRDYEDLFNLIHEKKSTYYPYGIHYEFTKSRCDEEEFIRRVKITYPEFDDKKYNFGNIIIPDYVLDRIKEKEHAITERAIERIQELQKISNSLFQEIPQLYISV